MAQGVPVSERVRWGDGTMKKAPDERGVAIIFLLLAVEGAVLLSVEPALSPVFMLAMVLMFLLLGVPPLSRDAIRQPKWRREDRFPKTRSGATLITTAVAMMLVAMCMTAVMQAYMQGGRAREVQARRTAATSACREAIEGARAHGYGGLKAAGDYTFAVRARQPMSGALQIAPGPVPDSKLVTVTVTWAADERAPAGSATLSTIMSARGIGG